MCSGEMEAMTSTNTLFLSVKNINDDALDGISTSCITHYANEEVGPNIEWDDDIDLNYTNSTTEQWERYFKED